MNTPQLNLQKVVQELKGCVIDAPAITRSELTIDLFGQRIQLHMEGEGSELAIDLVADVCSRLIDAQPARQADDI